MVSKTQLELVKARYNYFLDCGFLPVVAMKMAEETLPNGDFLWASGVDP